METRRKDYKFLRDRVEFIQKSKISELLFILVELGTAYSKRGKTLELNISSNKEEASKKAASKAASLLSQAISEKGEAVFVIATGLSQVDFLHNLTEHKSVDWNLTTMFHLDEYIGLAKDHRASFRRFLRERFLKEVNPGTVNFIEGSSDNPEAECRRLNSLISGVDVDVAFVGIGENGHLAFNDPPANFSTNDPYIIVDLDEKCRKQQVGEGWFDTVQEVPEKAISMSIQQIMNSKNIICTVPGQRKAKAVKDCFEGEISPDYPASILRRHKRAFVYLDGESAALIEKDY